MLGQLLHSLNTSPLASRRSSLRNPPLDSVTEDSHTLGLLFPDSSFLQQDHDRAAGAPQPFPSADAQVTASRTTGVYTDHVQEGLDLECPRDIRILIAQGESGSLQELLLFDSKSGSGNAESPRIRHSRVPSRSDTAGATESRGAAAGARPSKQPSTPSSGVPSIPEDFHRRTSSASNYAGSAGAFQRARFRRGSISSTHSLDESSQTRNRETDEIVRIALDCMFENATSSYKGTSNKIHIVPLGTNRPNDAAAMCSTSLNSDLSGFALAGRGGVVRRPSSLSRSHTPADPPLEPTSPLIESYANPQSQARRRTVMVTRTFSITWVDEESLEDQAISGQPGSSGGTTVRQSRSRICRSPMYAVTIILQLPIASQDSTPPFSRTGTIGRRGSRKDSTSHFSQTSFGSSFESDKRGTWPMADPMLVNDSVASVMFNSDVDERVDLIGQHWDIISRTLTTLQHLVQKKILELLRPLPRQRRPIKLLHLGLANDEDIKKAAEDAGVRVVRGMKIPRVRTGQGRWGLWREEARWLSKWAGGREENFFFLILITGFLGTHTEWLNLLAPKSYRHRVRDKQRLGPTEDLSVPNRTIVISSDKMAARRLVFLLSVFLPGAHVARGDASPLRPSTSASYRAYSQSPPGHMPLSRQESLRRTINRRGKTSQSKMRHYGSRGSSIVATSESNDDRTETGTIRGTDGTQFSHSRRPSDARSIMKANVSSPPNDSSATLSTPATTSTVDPSSTVPVAHFSLQRQRSLSGQSITQGQSLPPDSAASANLINTLQRNTSGSVGSDSQWGNRWVSLRNLWSMGTRRESTSEYGDILQTSDEGLGIVGVRRQNSTNALQRMVDDVRPEQTQAHHQDVQNSREDDVVDPAESAITDSLEIYSTSQSSLTKDATKPIDVPLKMSVNEADGVIDVEIPFPEFGSPMLSPTLPGDHSGSSYGGSSFGHTSILSISPKDSDHPLNVGGWLDKVHPDFALQAVKPYPEVMKDVMAAMSAEPNPIIAAPANEVGPVEKWLDVCKSLVADTTTFSIKRIRLRRLVRYTRQQNQPFTPIPPGLPPRSQYGNPYAQSQHGPSTAMSELILKETFEEEKIGDMDGAFVEVLERMLAHSGSPSKSLSSSSSRSSSRRGRQGSLVGAGEEQGTTSMAEPIEVSRSECKKMIISSLEQIASSVAKERSSAQRAESSSKPRPMEHSTEVESTLRDGIRKWFDEVESGEQLTVGSGPTRKPSAEVFGSRPRQVPSQPPQPQHQQQQEEPESDQSVLLPHQQEEHKPHQH